jgi:glycosyltransferase involved in cell wall biosynthesis
MEVIVADGMSSDGTRTELDRIASADGRVRVIDNPERITPIALNRAIEAARGSLILRIDAHSTIHPGYVRELVTFLESHPDAWGAGGRMRTEPDRGGVFAAAVTRVLSHRFGVGNSRFRTGTGDQPEAADTAFNCCWRREVFDRVGLFHRALVRSQDIEMSERIRNAGGSLWLVPTAYTTYFARVRFAAYLKHNFQNGVWSIVPLIHMGHLPVGWRHLVPLAFVSSLVLASLIALLSPGLNWLPLVPAAPYALVNLAASLTATRDVRVAALLPIAFAGLHLGYGAGSLWGAFHVLRSRLRAPRSPQVYDPRTNP